MKKIFLSVIGFAFICRLNSYAQTSVLDTGSANKPRVSLYTPIIPDSTDYSSRELRVDEINFVSSYYNQNGNHSPVTGGIGTEKVTDLANVLELKLGWTGDRRHKNSLDLSLGVDHHTSASAAYVSTTGASKTGGSRIYPALDWTLENPNNGSSFGVGTYYSGEYNYKSLGADLHFSKKTADKNGEFAVKLQGYFDNVTLIYPSELIPKTTTTSSTGTVVVTTASGRTSTVGANGKTVSTAIPTSPRNTFTASLSYSQMLSQRLQIMLLADGVTQSGYLGLPFHRVYFKTQDTAKVEQLPSTRYKVPIGIRLNYFLGDNVIIRSYYRYYADSWGTRSSTANLEIPYKISPFFSISPFYRYYTQTAARYFAPYKVHQVTDQYYTSNYAYSQFNSSFFGVGLRIAPPKGVAGWQSLHEFEIRYGHYSQTTDLASDVISVSFGFR